MKIRFIILVWAFLVIGSLLAGCLVSENEFTPTLEPTLVPTQLPTATPIPEPTGSWWNHAIFYQIFVRSFQDSDGDGIGDFQGIIDRLDYLNDGDPSTTDDLGINAIWLMPINPSPSYHGYDVVDYYDVNPDYGSMEDFKRLLAEAEGRGIRVIIDFVINHTSSAHPWFIESKNPESPYHDWYVWSEEDPGYLGPWSQDVWHPSSNGLYYYGVFWDQMPDLNHANPDVREQIEKVASFWVQEVGVDGFRIDAVRHLIEEGEDQDSTESTHGWFKEFHEEFQQLAPDIMVVGEVWTTSFEVIRYVKDDELDLAFNFDLADSIVTRVNREDAEGLVNTMAFETKLYPAGEMATFLTNHDQNRVMTVLMNDTAKARLAAAVLLTAPGIPFIYYGEEIGLTGQGDHLNIRTPMQWTSGENAGFTTGTPWNPLKRDADQVNVEVLEAQPSSLWHHYRRLIQLRSHSLALQQGDLVPLETSNPKVAAYLRVDPNDVVLVIMNLSPASVEDYSLTLDSSGLTGTYQLETLYGEEDGKPISFTGEGGLLEFQPLEILPASSSFIFRLTP